ncbi:MAG: Ger(x)C family spore germination protein [Ruminiclostridium sp.]
MKKFNILLIISILISLLTSCTTDSKEIDNQVYTLIIGCDKAVDNKIRLTVQYPTYKGGSGGGGSLKKDGGGNSGGESDNENGVVDNTIVQTVEASSILEALDLMNTSTTRKLSMVHTKAVVFSEEMAREGVKDYLQPIARFRETRRNMQMIVCRGKAQDFIMENKTSIGDSVAKAMELAMVQSDDSGFFPRAPFHEFYTAAISPYRQPYAIYAGINNYKHLKPIKEDSTSPLRPQYEILPGDIPRQGDRKLEMIGTAVFNGDKMVGTLSSYETRYLMMVLGSFKRGIMTIEDKNSDGDAIPLDIRLGRNTKINAYFENNNPVIDIKIEIEADVGAIQSSIPYEEVKNLSNLNSQIETTIKKGVEETIKKAQSQWNTDIFGFGKKISRNFFTTTEFEKYNWLEHFKDAKINVEVDSSVRRTGLMMESTPIKYSEMKK